MNERLRVRAILTAFAVLALVFLVAGCGPGGGPYFAWSLDEDRQSVAPGGTATFVINVRSKLVSFDEVNFRITGVPAHMDAAFNPSVLPPSGTKSTLTITTDSATPPGVYHMRVFAQETGGVEESEEIIVTVTSTTGEAGFTLETDRSEYTFEGTTDAPSMDYTVRRKNGFTGRVDISFGPHPDYVLIKRGPTPDHVTFGGFPSAGGTFVLGINTGAYAQGPFTLQVRATSGGVTVTRDIVLRFPL